VSTGTSHACTSAKVTVDHLTSTAFRRATTASRRLPSSVAAFRRSGQKRGIRHATWPFIVHRKHLQGN
jgi:hypothetical protein